MQYPPAHRCGACDAPAVFRYATCSPHERPGDALRRRPLFRCPACFPGGKPDYVAAIPADHVEWLLVIDAAYTRDVLEPRCGCGLPADHRAPLSGEPRPCADETARIVFPGSESRPPVAPSHAAILDFVRSTIGRSKPTPSPQFRHRDENGPDGETPR